MVILDPDCSHASAGAGIPQPQLRNPGQQTDSRKRCADNKMVHQTHEDNPADTRDR